MNQPNSSVVNVKSKTFKAAKYLRRRLADENALLPLSLMGVITGLLSGIVIQVFRFAIEWPGEQWLFGNHEAFEQLDENFRFLLPLYGALSLGIFLQFFIKNMPTLGVSHVLQRMSLHHGRLSLRAAVLQFLLGVWCILTGQSAGREGAAVHLGAAVSSYTGQFWKLPNNSIRVLAGCGTAAAIAASFNTPIAGVIFAMEVIMMEYTIAGFIPIMLAASAGTIISYLVYGSSPAFIPPILDTHTIMEVPVYVALGIVIGTAAAAFCAIHQQTLKLNHLPIWVRFTLGGLITGALAFYLPEIMGIGYDTLDLALEAQLGLYLMLGIGIAKIIASAFSSGLGMPIGVIGPNLVAGGCLGGAIGIVVNYIAPETISNDSLYVMLGMGAMMGAVMNAPLAALIALLELTNTPDIILPAMIAIVVATLTNTQIFQQKPPHIQSLDHTGTHRQLSAFDIALQRIGVTSLMNTNIAVSKRILTQGDLIKLIESNPRWIIAESLDQPPVLLNTVQLAMAYEEDAELKGKSIDKEIDITGIPATNIKVANLHFQASAFEAWELMEKEGVDAIYITGMFDAYAPAVSGIITREDIDNYYHSPRNI